MSKERYLIFERLGIVARIAYICNEFVSIPMKRNRAISFITVHLSLLIIPMLLPFLLGGIVLPVWSYLIYTIVVVVNASLFLINSLFLIDKFLIRGKTALFILANIAILSISFGIETFSATKLGEFIVINGIPWYEIINHETIIGQIVTCFFWGIISIYASLAFSLSDEWKVAKLRYNDAMNTNSQLMNTVSELENKVSTLSKENESIRQNSNKASIISVKVDLMMRNIKIDDICYIESEGDYIHIFTADGKSYMTLMTMKNMEKMLPFDSFCRVHRSYIVNVERVSALKDRKLLVLEKQIPLADSCKAAFFEILSHKTVLLKSE